MAFDSAVADRERGDFVVGRSIRTSTRVLDDAGDHAADSIQLRAERSAHRTEWLGIAVLLRGFSRHRDSVRPRAGIGSFQSRFDGESEGFDEQFGGFASWHLDPQKFGHY